MKLQAYRVACCQHDVPVSRAPTGVTSPPAPGPLRVRVHPSMSFTSPTEFQPLLTCPALACETPPLGFPSPSRHQQKESTCERASQAHPMFRPRRFSRPRRFAPLSALRVYFTPQPRPGFTFQGFFSRCQARMPRRHPVPSCWLPAVACRRVASTAPAPPDPPPGP
jgi:hypothetical protein